MAAPVIEHPRDVHDGLLHRLRALILFFLQQPASHDPQDDIIVLRSVILFSDPHFFEDIRAHHHKMTDIVVRQQQIQIKIELEMGIVKTPSRLVTFILVGIRKIRPALLHGMRHLVQRICRQQVIMIQQTVIIPCGKLDRPVCVLRYAVVSLESDIPDARIMIPVYRIPDDIARTAVRNDELPVSIGLCDTAVDQCAHIDALRLIRRYKDRKFQIRNALIRPLPFQCILVGRTVIIICTILGRHALPRRDGRLAIAVFPAVVHRLSDILYQRHLFPLRMRPHAFFSRKIFLVTKLYTITIAVAITFAPV